MGMQWKCNGTAMELQWKCSGNVVECDVNGNAIEWKWNGNGWNGMTCERQKERCYVLEVEVQPSLAAVTVEPGATRHHSIARRIARQRRGRDSHVGRHAARANPRAARRRSIVTTAQGARCGLSRRRRRAYDVKPCLVVGVARPDTPRRPPPPPAPLPTQHTPTQPPRRGKASRASRGRTRASRSRRRAARLSPLPSRWRPARSPRRPPPARRRRRRSSRRFTARATSPRSASRCRGI